MAFIREYFLYVLLFQTILFTVNEAVLERVSLHDPVFQSDLGHRAAALTDSTPNQHDDHAHGQLHRPTTAHSRQDNAAEDDNCRPFTCANTPAESAIRQPGSKVGGRVSDFCGMSIELVLAENWGAPGRMGLTSVALLEAGSRQPVALRPDQVTVSLAADPMTPEGAESGEVARLVDGVDVTTDESHMWACPVPRPQSPTSSPQFPSITFTLDTPTSLAGLRVWNYNASMEDSYKGVSEYLIWSV